MEKKRFLAVLCIALALLPAAASAAVIHGTVYGIGLEEAEDAVVSIDTTPRQQKVAKNSTYFFNVPAGTYTITASKFSGSEVVSFVEENITVAVEGDYVIDLILFPSFEEEEQLLSDAEFEIEEGLLEEEEPNYIGIGLLVLAMAAFFLILRMREKELKRKREEMGHGEPGELRKVVAFIKKQGGRTTQKEIRKNFPQSEAKISLIIAELEESGAIRKIKKGRGNIIILNR